VRRFWYWYLPLLAAMIAASIFGAGFYSFLRGDIGVGRRSRRRPRPILRRAPASLR
jgi:hypothetical protein